MTNPVTIAMPHRTTVDGAHIHAESWTLRAWQRDNGAVTLYLVHDVTKDVRRVSGRIRRLEDGIGRNKLVELHLTTDDGTPESAVRPLGATETAANHLRVVRDPDRETGAL